MDTQPIITEAKKPLSGWSLLLALGFSLALSFFVLRGGWSLGFLLAAICAEIVIWVFPRLSPSYLTGRKRPRQDFIVHLILTAVVLDLSACMFIYSNEVVRVLNVLVLLVIIPYHLLLAAGTLNSDLSRLACWLEVGVSYFIRPFTGLSGFAASVQKRFRKPARDSSHSRSERSVAGKILLGILIAFPIMLLTGALLSSADQIFSNLIGDMVSTLFNQRITGSILLAVILFPFIFSYMYTTKYRTNYIDKKGASDHISNTVNKYLRIDKVILISFLSCINLIYILFAAIQAVYLTGAFSAHLPDSMTYAQYARSGFFELAAVTVINILLILWASKSSDRQGMSGTLVMIEIILLIFASLVQWASAMFRMSMYVDAYGLTLMRFWVTAFMIMLLVIVAIVTIRLFLPKIPLVKLVIAVMLVSLITLNHLNSESLVANYNTQRLERTGRMDSEYFDMLGWDAVPVMITLLDSDDVKASTQVALTLNGLNRQLNNRRDLPWQSFNLSESRASQLIDSRLDQIKSIVRQAKP